MILTCSFFSFPDTWAASLSVASASLSFAMDVIQALDVGQPTMPMAVVAAVLSLVAIPLTHGWTGMDIGIS